MAYTQKCPDCGGSGEVIEVQWRDGRKDDYTGSSYNIGDISEVRKLSASSAPYVMGRVSTITTGMASASLVRQSNANRTDCWRRKT
jgi:hypothetical protein